MIKLDKVSKYYTSGNNVSLGLHNVSIEMEKGELIAVIGESGSGKSTFLNVVTGLDTYEDGEIYYNDVAASSMTSKEMGEFRKNNIGFIFQNYNLIDSYTVLQNVMMPLILKGMTTKEAKPKAKELLNKVGLSKRIHHKGTKLSGGEKQRCVIARALASDSEILACDEPTGNLDSKTGREIIELIKEVASDKLVLIVTHNYEELEDIATRRIKFADGELIEDTKLLPKEKVENQSFKGSESIYNFRKSEKLSLSIKDIFTTPKKSILTTIIFVALAFFTAFLYVGIITYTDPYDYTMSLINNDNKDRIIVLANNDNFNLDDFKDYKYFINPTYEDIYFSLSKENGDSAINTYLRMDATDVKLKKGRMPENPNEIILGVRDDEYSTYYNETLTVKLDEQFTKVKVVGYYCFEKNDYSQMSYAITGVPGFNKLLQKHIVRISYDNLLEFEMENNSYIPYQIDYNLGDKIIINVSKDLENLGLDVLNIIKLRLYKNTYNLPKENIEIRYSEDYSTKFMTIIIGDEAFDRLYESNIYMISIYETDKDTKNNIISSLRKKGYTAALSSDIKYQEDLSIDGIMNTIVYMLYMMGVVFGLIAVFFISYVVLSKIYAVKNKDYTILRTIGMQERDMSLMVIVQTIFIGLISTFIVLIVLYTTLLFDKPLIKNIKEVNAFEIMIYILFMSFYSYLFAIRFNKRLFKFSVSKTLRGGVIGND